MKSDAIWTVQPSSLSPSPRIVHEHSALTFFTDGSGVLEQGSRFDVSAGDVFLSPAGATHRCFAAKKLAGWGIGIDVAGLRSSELAPYLDVFARTRHGALGVVAIPAHREEYLARLCLEMASIRGREPILERSLLALVLAEVAHADARSNVTEHSTAIGRALDFIERNCLGAISLRDVARATGQSAAHLANSLKRGTGRTVGEWIRIGRLREACRRLAHSDDSINAISEAIGYADSTHFIRVFHRAYGLTPAKWRSRVARRGRTSSQSVKGHR